MQIVGQARTELKLKNVGPGHVLSSKRNNRNQPQSREAGVGDQHLYQAITGRKQSSEAM